jgi:hypothetical protein
VERAGRPLVEIETTTQMRVRRAGELSTFGERTLSLETPAGGLLSFEASLEMGGAPQQTTGRVVGSELLLEAAGQPPRRLKWPAGGRGFSGVEQSLAERPLAAGERRRLEVLLPVLYQVALVTLQAKQEETVELPEGLRRLLRVDVETRLPGVAAPLRAVHWVDGQGLVQRVLDETTGQVALRTTQAKALAPAAAGGLDLLAATTVRIARPLPQGHRTRRARYRVRLRGGDPAEAFLHTSWQEVRPAGPGLAEITVRACRPADLPPGSKKAPATDAQLLASPLIQVDDPQVRALAERAAGQERDTWQQALALERMVRETVQTVTFSQALVSAAEVAQSRRGDCTEFAVLLAAMARARGIPARVSAGLVYLSGQQAFGFHMWTEVLVDGVWYGLDGTLAAGGTGAGHLTLARTDLANPAALVELLPVAQVMGRLEIELLEAE